MRAYIRWMIAVSLLLMLALSSSANVVDAGGFSAGIGGLSWSPDGKSLLYVVYKDGVFVVTPGDDPRRIADTDDYESPQWSPDGQFIISTLAVDNQTGIFRTPVTGGEPQRLTEDVGWRPGYYAPNGIQPVYSPDGKSIAFLSLREGDAYMSLYSMNADGEDEHVLTDVGTVDTFVWSPDSQAIAFIADSPGSFIGGSDLFLVDSHGTKLRRLTNTVDVDSSYAINWTPDGRHIVFTSKPDDQTKQREIIDMDGQNRKNFAEQPSDATASPDGKYILFTTPAEPWPKLSIKRADGDGSDTVTISLPGKRAYYDAVWSPDSQSIAFVSFLFDAPKSESIILINADGTNPQTLMSIPIS